MAADMTGEQLQAKITAARREAEGLKDKIRRRKEELADTTCTDFPCLFAGFPTSLLPSVPFGADISMFLFFSSLLFLFFFFFSWVVFRTEREKRKLVSLSLYRPPS